MISFGWYQITIEAPRETVWSFVAKIEKLNLWWPARFQATGVLREGQELSVMVRMPRTEVMQADVMQEVRVLIEQLDPPCRVVFLQRRTDSTKPIGRNVLTLEDTPRGCRVRLRMFVQMRLMLIYPLTWVISLLLNSVWPFTHLSPLYKLKRLVHQEVFG